jgi:hypothetical protein
MAANRSTQTPAEVTPTETGPSGGAAAVIADPALVAPDSPPVATTEVIEEPTQAVTPPAAAPAQQVVYVQAPKPFVRKGNRGFGVLIAILSTVIFAALYALALVVIQVVEREPVNVTFVETTDFWAPPVMFAIGFILLVLLVNRAGWAAHVVGSLFVGLVVYFGGTGAILLLNINQIPSNRVSAAFDQVIFNPATIIAALLAREVALWMGAAIASRGRRVRTRNVDARVLYDQEIATKRAEYEQANSAAVVAPSPVEVPVAEAPVVDTPAAEVPAAEVPATEVPVAEVPVAERETDAVAP